MIYILKFERPLGNPAKKHGTAQFYVGYCDDGKLERRLKAHRTGRGAAITRAASQQGISFEVVLTLPGDRNTERAIKNQKNTRKFVERTLRLQINMPCAVCGGTGWTGGNVMIVGDSVDDDSQPCPRCNPSNEIPY